MFITCNLYSNRNILIVNSIKYKLKYDLALTTNTYKFTIKFSIRYLLTLKLVKTNKNI